MESIHPAFQCSIILQLWDQNHTNRQTQFSECKCYYPFWSMHLNVHNNDRRIECTWFVTFLTELFTETSYSSSAYAWPIQRGSLQGSSLRFLGRIFTQDPCEDHHSGSFRGSKFLRGSQFRWEYSLKILAKILPLFGINIVLNIRCTFCFIVLLSMLIALVFIRLLGRLFVSMCYIRMTARSKARYVLWVEKFIFRLLRSANLCPTTTTTTCPPHPRATPKHERVHQPWDKNGTRSCLAQSASFHAQTSCSYRNDAYRRMKILLRVDASRF